MGLEFHDKRPGASPRPVLQPLRGLVHSIIFVLLLRVPAQAQAIYVENQIPARGVEIEYAVTVTNPISHLYDVDMNVRGMRTTSIDVVMPAWEPGNYSIRDFAKNVQDFRSTSGRNQPLAWTQTDKLTWRISKNQAEDVSIH